MPERHAVAGRQGRHATTKGAQTSGNKGMTKVQALNPPRSSSGRLLISLGVAHRGGKSAGTVDMLASPLSRTRPEARCPPRARLTFRAFHNSTRWQALESPGNISGTVLHRKPRGKHDRACSAPSRRLTRCPSLAMHGKAPCSHNASHTTRNPPALDLASVRLNATGYGSHRDDGRLLRAQSEIRRCLDSTWRCGAASFSRGGKGSTTLGQLDGAALAKLHRRKLT